MKHLLAIPVYNERETIEEIISDTLSLLHKDVCKIVLIDDGSTDGSSLIIDELVQKNPKRLIAHHAQVNQGYGASMITAMKTANLHQVDFLITMDCDRQHRPEDIDMFVTADPAIDVVSGSRYLPMSGESGIAPPVERVEINRRITKMLNRKCGWSISDSFCGFKRYRMKSIRPELFCETGYSFPLEFWAFAQNQNLSIVEIPVSKIYTTDNRSFGEDLDQTKKRLHYYLQTWYRSVRRFTKESRKEEI